MAYPGFEKFYLAIDCVIFGLQNNVLKVFTVPRAYEPFRGMASLPTSFIGNDESTDDAALRVIYSITGKTHTYFRQLEVFSKPDRDEAGRVVSVAYYALVNLGECSSDLKESKPGTWKELDKARPMVFDHMDMVLLAKKRLRSRVKTHPVAFRLLGEKFTLTQLQNLYESIFGYELDKRNFRKRVLQMNILDKLEEKDKTTSKRGAYLYRYNSSKYKELLQSGNVFSLY